MASVPLAKSQDSKTAKLDEISYWDVAKGWQEDGLDQDLAALPLGSYIEGPLVANRDVDDCDVRINDVVQDRSVLGVAEAQAGTGVPAGTAKDLLNFIYYSKGFNFLI